MGTSFVLAKTFEPRQQSDRSNMDLMISHPSFWGDLPENLTNKPHIAGIIRSGGTIKIQVPGFTDFFIKAVEYGTTRNGNWLLCGLLANNRQ